MNPSGGRRILAWLWLLALFVWWVRYYPLGQDVAVVDDDTRQHTYWMARFQDPELFPNDRITDFVSSSIYAPIGHRAVYWAGTRLVDPLKFSRWLSLLLMLGSLWLLDAILRESGAGLAGRGVGGLLFLFYHTHNTVHNIQGGFARSYAVPLLLGTVLLLQRKAFRTALAGMLAQAVLYPPVLLNSLAVAGADLLRQLRSNERGRAWLVNAALLALTATLTLGPALLVYGQKNPLAGPRVTLEQAKGMAEFHAGGRSVFFEDNLLLFYLTGRSGIGLLHFSGFLVLVVVIATVVGWKKMKVPRMAWDLTWTSLVLFGAAHAMLFRLYLPSRYTFYTISTAFLMVIAVNAEGFRDAIMGRFAGLAKLVRATPKWVEYAMLAALLGGYAVAQQRWILPHDPRLVVLDRADLDLFRFLEQLPKDALVAGHPWDMDNVPLMARRSVVANGEISHPYYMGFYAYIRPRIADTLRAYYAKDWSEVEAFARQYNVSALVVRRDRFPPPERSRLFFEPYESEVRAWLGERKQFALADPPASELCYENSRYRVLCFDERNPAQGLGPGPHP